MWYWVKAPEGQENDYNLEELKIALAEGRLQADSPARRHNESEWFPVAHLLEQDDHEQEKPPPAYISFVCGKCHNTMRIRLPLRDTSYSCEHCQTGYMATKVSDSPLTYVLMPQISS